jgi:glycosyltransferase involved in cell wall biosynthesis
MNSQKALPDGTARDTQIRLEERVDALATKEQIGNIAVTDYMPLVSVLLKSYNHEAFISEAIESVLKQSFGDIELIIVDDASTDRSRSLIEHYAQQDARIKVIFHEQNEGITKVVNDGLDAAKGKFIAQLDSDDVWVNDKLHTQLAVLGRNENLVVWSEGTVVDQTGRPTGKTFSELVQSTSKMKSGALFQALLPGNYIFGSTLMYKKANLDGLRYEKCLTYNNDYKFLLELALKYEFYYIAEPLAKYRIHGKNTLVGSDPEAMKRIRRGRAEEICIRRDALLKHQKEMSEITKAEIYTSLCFCYAELGEHRKAFSSYMQAIKHAPYRLSNLVHLAHFFHLALVDLFISRT